MKILKFFLIGCLFIAAGTPNSVQAALITVTSSEDGPPANDGECTLREAILAANSNTAANGCPAGESASRDVISLTGLSDTIILTETLPNIIESVVIAGPGARQLAISANNNPAINKIFHFSTAVDSRISGLTLQGINQSSSADGVIDIGIENVIV